MLTAPSISGAPLVGGTLTADLGTWEDADGFTVRWQRCAGAGTGCADIAGATAETYRVEEDDAGNRLRVVVVARNRRGERTASSEATAAVAQGYAQMVVADDPTGYWAAGPHAGCDGRVLAWGKGGGAWISPGAVDDPSPSGGEVDPVHNTFTGRGCDSPPRSRAGTGLWPDMAGWRVTVGRGAALAAWPGACAVDPIACPLPVQVDEIATYDVPLDASRIAAHAAAGGDGE
jgi:hypothetical protein